MTRRGRGEGTVFQRADGLWCGVVPVGYDQNGKRKRRAVYGATQQEVIGKIAEVRADGCDLNIVRFTVATYLEHWLKAVRANLAESTALRYDQVIKLKINPLLGGVRLTALRASHVQRAYSKLQEDGKSARARAMTHEVLHAALKQAERWGYVSRNVCGRVAKPRREKTEMRVLTAEQCARFFEASRGDRFHALFVLAATTGARQGELLALEWRDLDLEAGTMQLQRGLHEIKGRLSVGDLKTERSRRLVHLSGLAVAVLRDHRRRQFEHETQSLQSMAHEAKQDRTLPLVFPDGAGGYMRKSNLTRRHLVPLLKAADLERVRFHDLRHSAATLLLNDGVHPAVASAILGHSSVKTTLDIYSHVSAALGKEAARGMDRTFSACGYSLATVGADQGNTPQPSDTRPKP